jgi:hypothetical protein
MGLTYFLHGGPKGEPKVLPGMSDDIAHVLQIERQAEAGVVDLYVLSNHSATFGTAAYRWDSSGTPEEVMATVAEWQGARG